MTAKVYANSGSTVNMRTNPDLKSKVVVQVPIGSVVEVINKGVEWSEIKCNNSTGYMMMKYLRFNKETEDYITVSRAKLEQIYKEIGELLIGQ